MHVKLNADLSVTNSPGAIDAGAVFCSMGLYQFVALTVTGTNVALSL